MPQSHYWIWRHGGRERETKAAGKESFSPLFPPIAEIADSFLLPPPRQICHVSFSVSPDSEPPPHGILLYSPVIQSLHPSRVMEGGAVEIGMDRQCDSPNHNGRREEDEEMVNGMEDAFGHANNDVVEQEESTDSIPSPLFLGPKPKKRLTSKVWDDFIPSFVNGKLVHAECMHCHRVFNCGGTSSLWNHQARCSPSIQAQKRPKLHGHAPCHQRRRTLQQPFLIQNRKGSHSCYLATRKS
ncbi:hypothetical protein PVAP13_2NG328309 [Panicum virgatum]|uniref:BED-type domain-containing protein n=1 Tax=Panicum virgatum TaxID=38727 RepID=A0A8T0VTJ7_PANVG|nr:hypothetical protein PVAP13_2NG328309 [Panicum virgatum]